MRPALRPLFATTALAALTCACPALAGASAVDGPLPVVQPDSTAQSRDIKIVATDGETTAVTGVKPGEQLVTDGFDKLQSGTKIAVRQPQAAPAAGSPAPTPARE